MKALGRALVSVFLFVFSACGSSVGLEPTDLSSADIHNIGAAFSNASLSAYTDLVNTINAGSAGGNIELDDTYACPAGKIVSTGTIAYQAGDGGTLAGDVAMALSDGANSNNDCGVTGDLFLDGTVAAQLEGTVSGTIDRGTMTIDVAIGLNRLDSDGSYIPITSDCPVHLTAELTTDGAYTFGTICGNAWSNAL